MRPRFLLYHQTRLFFPPGKKGYNHYFMSGPVIPPPPIVGGAGTPVVAALIQLIIGQVPGFAIGMRIINNQMLNQILRVIKENIVGLIGSLLSTVGIAALVPSLIIATVNAIGFTSGGVLAGTSRLSKTCIIFTLFPDIDICHAC